jgi:adenosylhomocysteine nucleosidase
VIDHWRPELVINLGTCGGLAGQIKVNETVLATETVYYDVIERMGDPAAAVDFYSTKIDLSFIRTPYPMPVHVGRLACADQDIDPAMVNTLSEKFHVVAADWESGAIAWVAQRNHTRCLILRGVTDVVNPTAGEIYNDEAVEFHVRAAKVMQGLIENLPKWLERIK